MNGEPLPYLGWTLPQFRVYAAAASRSERRGQATAMQNMATAIGACFSKDVARKMSKLIDKLTQQRPSPSGRDEDDEQ